MGGVDREELLGAIRAASEEGARNALAGLQQDSVKCALFAVHGSEEARVHARHHDQIGRYFAPFVKKAEGLAVTIASWAFWVVIVAGVLIIILLAADVKPLSFLHFHLRDAGGK